MPRESSFLSLGALHRTLARLAAPERDATIGLHFEQRSTTQRASEESVPPELVLARHFEATLSTRDGALTHAELRSGGRSRSPAAWLHLTRVDDSYVYTVDGVRFGRLREHPDLFDLLRFQHRLDTIGVADVTVETVDRNGESAVVLDAEVGVAAFRRLMSLFAGDPAEDELELRSYSVTLSAGPNVALDYWWSLAGAGGMDDGRYRQSIACHVQVTLSPAPPRNGVPAPVALEVTMPELRHLDEVWELARASAAGAAQHP